MDHNRLILIKNIYGYLVLAISVVVLLIGSIDLLNTVLRTYVFHVEDFPQFTGPIFECSVESLKRPGPKLEEMVPPTIEEIEECKREVRDSREAENRNQTKREFARNISMIVIVLPFILFHWRLVRG